MAAAQIGPVRYPDAGVSSWRPVEQRTFVSMQIAGRIRDEVARALSPFPRVVVAVSGGLDSMTLLDAV